MRRRFRSRFAAVCVTTTLVAGLGGLSLTAQEPAKVEKKVSSLARRIPSGFSKLGVTAEQKEKIYAVRGRHQEKIATLEQEIEAIKAKEIEECEAVLTDAQRKLLATLRDESKAKGKAAPVTKKTAEK